MVAILRSLEQDRFWGLIEIGHKVDKRGDLWESNLLIGQRVTFDLMTLTRVMCSGTWQESGLILFSIKTNHGISSYFLWVAILCFFLCYCHFPVFLTPMKPLSSCIVSSPGKHRNCFFIWFELYRRLFVYSFLIICATSEEGKTKNGVQQVLEIALATSYDQPNFHSGLCLYWNLLVAVWGKVYQLIWRYPQYNAKPHFEMLYIWRKNTNGHGIHNLKFYLKLEQSRILVQVEFS